MIHDIVGNVILWLAGRHCYLVWSIWPTSYFCPKPEFWTGRVLLSDFDNQCHVDVVISWCLHLFCCYDNGLILWKKARAPKEAQSLHVGCVQYTTQHNRIATTVLDINLEVIDTQFIPNTMKSTAGPFLHIHHIKHYVANSRTTQTSYPFYFLSHLHNIAHLPMYT